MKDAAFINSQYILDLLSEIDKVIEAHLKFHKQIVGSDDFRGLYISEADIDSLLGERPHSKNKVLIEHFEKTLAKITRKNLETCVELRLETLRKTFELKPLEIFSILIALAPELDSKYGKFFAYLHDDVTQKKPTIGLILNLFCESKIEKINSRKHFYNASPLIGNSILRIEEENISLIEKTLRIDERFLRFILGESDIEIENLVNSV